MAAPGLIRADEVRVWKQDEAQPPLFIAPRSTAFATLDAFLDWLRDSRAGLDALLVEHGAIVFRGFPIGDAQDFHAFLDLFDPFTGDYRGGATPRDAIQGKVYEATKLTASAKLPLHQEMAYLNHAPGRVAFFCRKPAEVGGATTIADMRRITAELPGWLSETLDTHGILSVRNFSPRLAEGEVVPSDHPDQRPWDVAFYTTDRDVVEASCRDKQMDCIWGDDGGLTVRNRLAAFAAHPVTGQRVYRNVLHTNAGRDMTPDLPADRQRALDEMFARQALFAANELSWQWQAGDVMLLDNLFVAHGRNPYEGTRDVQVGLLA